MRAPQTPADEDQRLNMLRGLCVLDTAPEERFDRLTRMAQRMFNVPIALVSLIDSNRQWFKSRIGLEVTETAREISFCGHAILEDDVLLIENALLDDRFSDNPLVLGPPHIRFYAGCPLKVGDMKLGTLCLIDDKGRVFEDLDYQLLRDLAKMAEMELASTQLALTDELTSLSNRRGFEMLSLQAIRTCERLGKPATLLFFDLNDFKKINDNFGHHEGDHVLKVFADTLLTLFRGSDVISRIGGDEFVVLLTDADQQRASLIISRMHEWIDRINRGAQRGYDIRFSVGHIEYDRSRHTSTAVLLADADAAMYACKQAYRNKNIDPSP